jgi:hypothetical protein
MKEVFCSSERKSILGLIDSIPPFIDDTDEDVKALRAFSVSKRLRSIFTTPFVKV